MDLTFLFDAEAKITNPKWVEERIREYVSTCPVPTFLGLLNHMGLIKQDIVDLREKATQGNKNAKKVWRYLELFKNKIEANIIEKCTYQSAHPEIGDRHIDYKTLQWVYEKQNPPLVKEKSNSPKLIKYDLTNDSGHQID